eukprot:6454880-Amphidinium_carterae.1
MPCGYNADGQETISCRDSKCTVHVHYEEEPQSFVLCSPFIEIVLFFRTILGSTVPSKFSAYVNFCRSNNVCTLSDGTSMKGQGIGAFRNSLHGLLKMESVSFGKTCDNEIRRTPAPKTLRQVDNYH